MGRGRSKAGGGTKSFAAGLVDSLSFNSFIKANIGNPDFLKFGQENSMDDVRQLWYERRLIEEYKTIKRISDEAAVDQVREAIPSSVINGWFVNADSDYKPKLVDAIVSNPGTLNAGLNVAYRNYTDSVLTGNPMPFEKWLKTPQTVYRGDHGQKAVKSDLFMSYTPDRKVALSFGKNITTKKVKPINTWGSYQTTGEQEFLIPVKRKGK